MPYFRRISSSVTSEELNKPECILCQSHWLCCLLKYAFFHHLWTGIVGSNPNGIWMYACIFPVLCCFVQGEELWWEMMAPNMYKQDLYTYKLGVLGLHWPVSTTKWNGIHFKIRIPLSCQFKVCGLLTCTEMVDDDNHHWHKLFKCTSTVCNVMLVHFTRSTLLYVFTAEFC